MEGPVQVRRAVDEDKGVTLAHRDFVSWKVTIQAARSCPFSLDRSLVCLQFLFAQLTGLPRLQSPPGQANIAGLFVHTPQA